MITKFKDFVAVWAKAVAGIPTEPVTEAERQLITDDLSEFLGCLNLDNNQIQFKDFTVHVKRLNDNEQKVTFKIECVKQGLGGLVVVNQ